MNQKEKTRREQVNKKIDSLLEQLETIFEDNNLAFVIGYQDYGGVTTFFEGANIILDGMMKQLENEFNSDEYEK